MEGGDVENGIFMIQNGKVIIVNFYVFLSVFVLVFSFD